MDAVIPYVNSMDAEWRMSYALNAGGHVNEQQYFDWGTLKYVLRGIEENMPFIENVFLIVASESQIPDYVNRETVKIVFHEDFIPKEYLPTFNSCTIEMFLWNIHGLSEQFIYFNDDIIPCNPIQKEQLFTEDGRPVIQFDDTEIPNQQSRHSRIVRNDNIICNSSNFLLRPIHGICSYLKSEYKNTFETFHYSFIGTITPTRSNYNVSQWAFAINLKMQGLCSEMGAPSFKYGTTTEERISSEDLEKYQMVCINDMGYDSDYQEKLTVMLNNKLPNKSIYEL